MSRQASPNIAPEVPYVESSLAQSIPAQSTYYEVSSQRQLMTDEMMEDISRIAEAGQGTELPNGRNHGLASIVQTSTSADANPTTPIMSQQEQQPLASPMSASQPRHEHRVNSTSSDQYGDGSNKRKRSKVSRACDDCRRKKVRCDATKDDGTIETCSNCKRINSTCTFSRQPMKRGPSKGYIKELSERVQKMEKSVETQRSLSQMGPPISFRNSLDGRQSFDANTPGFFDSTSSPTDPLFSRKRTFSTMSEGNIGVGPFAQPQYTGRDRMPSHGWSLVSPQGYPQTPRYSVAIAPDQIPDIPPPSTVTSAPQASTTNEIAKPFWAEVQDQHPQETINQIATSVPEATQTGYQHYLASVHPILPLLPSTWTAIERHLRNISDEKLNETFMQMLSVDERGSDREQNTPATRVSHALVFALLRSSPKDRSQSENFVVMWLGSLLYLKFSGEVSKQTQCDQERLLQKLIDISIFLSQDLDAKGLEASYTDMDSDRNLARRSFIVITILARLYSLSSGPEEILHPDSDGARLILGDNDDIAMLSDATNILSRYIYPLMFLELSLPYSLAPAHNHRILSFNTFHINSLIRELKDKLVPDPMSFQAYHLVCQLDHLIQLLDIRNWSNVNPMLIPSQIFVKAESIVEYLAEGSYLLHRNSLNTTEVVQPIIPHLFVFVGITLLEFASSSSIPQNLEENLDEVVDPAIVAQFHLSTLVDTLDKNHITSAASQSPTSWSVALKTLITHRLPNLPPPPAAKARGRDHDGVTANGSISTASATDGNTEKESEPAPLSFYQLMDKARAAGAAAERPEPALTIRDPELFHTRAFMVRQDFRLLGSKGYMSVLGNLAASPPQPL